MKLPPDNFKINHEHKTWTPDDRIYYEKEMIKYRLKIAGIVFLAALLLMALLPFLMLK